MGQRHQIFIKAYTHDQGEESTHTAAFHHQWLYGATLVKQVKNLIKFYDNNRKQDSMIGRLDKPRNYLYKDSIDNIVKNAFMFNADTGYCYERLHNLNDDLKDFPKGNLPDQQDNNDGQTFIDFTVNGKASIGFAFPHDTYFCPGEDDEENCNKKIDVYKWHVMSLREYFNLYYDLDGILNDKTHQLHSFIKEIHRDITYVERRTKLMSQKHFFNMYPHLKDDFDTFKYKRIQASK